MTSQPTFPPTFTTQEKFESWKASRAAAITSWLDDWYSKRFFGPGCGAAEFEGSDWREQAVMRLWTRLHYRYEVERRHQEAQQ